MKTLPRLLALTLFLAPLSFTQTGCFWLTAQGPNLGPLAVPSSGASRYTEAERRSILELRTLRKGACSWANSAR